ncbi:MAG: SLC13 family permease [Infirmifilum sp.]
MPAGDIWGRAAGLAIIGVVVAGLVLRSKRPQVPVWSIMAFASFLAVISGLVGVDEVGSVVELDVILFLVGMFSLVALAEESGLLDALSYAVVSRVHSTLWLYVLSSFLFGLLAAITVNDTVALVGPPIAYVASRASGVKPEAFFLLLAFSLTIGSVMTPIGNPQNMLIASGSGVQAPFILFLYKLALPTLVNLAVTPLILARVFRIRNARVEVVLIPEEAIQNRRDALLAGVGITATIFALVANDLFELLGLPHMRNRGFIPFIVAAGLYLFASEPRKVLSRVDWGTVVFFISMFIAMSGVWRSGVLEPLLQTLLPAHIGGWLGLLRVTTASIVLSQFLSNVPATGILITQAKMLGYTGADTAFWLAMAAATTVAGNLTLLGAASNIIVLESLESRYGYTISFTRFLRVGVLVTTVNTLVYLVFILV